MYNDRMFRVLTGAIVCALSIPSLTSCVSEQMSVNSVSNRAPVFRFTCEYPLRVLQAGSYHGTSLFFEMDVEKDILVSLDEEARSAGGMDSFGPASLGENVPLKLPPVTPTISGGKEVYRVGSIHHVELYQGRWEVGAHRYPTQNRSRLYIFKRQTGDFTFFFRGQELVVKTKQSWIPSLYYHSEQEEIEDAGTKRVRAGGTYRRGGRKRLRVVREIVQVGLSTIELEPRTGKWTVNGRSFTPADGPVRLYGAVKNSGESISFAQGADR